MKKTNTNTIIFAQASDSTKAVVANKYVAYALYTQNKALVESLGGTVLKGVGGFRAEFKTVKNAKDFIAQAITHIDADEYAKTRKTEPKPKKVAPTTAKGKKADNLVTVTLVDGTQLQVSKSALGIAEKKAPRKSKGDKPTTAPNANTKAEPKKKTEPRKAKGDAFNFNTIKGETNKEKNKALHAELVKMGLKDSRVAEYQAIWNARPWAK